MASGFLLIVAIVQLLIARCTSVDMNSTCCPDVNMKGEPGVPGKQGVQGYKGEPGDQGATGPPGQRGVPGLQGIRGVRGYKGEKGNTGNAGMDGAKGDPGGRGLPGVRGPLGPPGALGKTGNTGVTGPQGPPGNTGQEGPLGLPGLPGQKGQKGLKGGPGIRGPPGIAGLDGTQGNPGHVGPVGPTGSKGEKGQRGIPGHRGQPGTQGVPGPPIDEETSNSIKACCDPVKTLQKQVRDIQDQLQLRALKNQPAAHISGLHPSSNYSVEVQAGVLVRHWRDSLGSIWSPQLRGEMRYSSGVITVPKGGFYYVYAAIFFYHHFESSSIACGYCVYVNSVSYINAFHRSGDKGSARDNASVYVGRILNLTPGARLYLKLTDTCRVVFYPERSFFGALFLP